MLTGFLFSVLYYNQIKLITELIWRIYIFHLESLQVLSFTGDLPQTRGLHSPVPLRLLGILWSTAFATQFWNEVLTCLLSLHLAWCLIYSKCLISLYLNFAEYVQVIQHPWTSVFFPYVKMGILKPALPISQGYSYRRVSFVKERKFGLWVYICIGPRHPK